MRNWSEAKTETCCSFSASNMVHFFWMFWQSPRLIHSSSHSLVCSFSFPHDPSACHSFISLIVSSFVSPPLSKILLFRSSNSGINSSQQHTGSISLYLALVLFSSLSFSFIPALFMDQYPALLPAQRRLRVIKEALQ